MRHFPQSKYVGRAQKAISAIQVENTSAALVKKSQTQSDGDIKMRFDRAMACYENLRDTPNRQKYRDAWLPCITQFDKTYRNDPAGDWAAASLYMSGTLYYKLYKLSFNSGDKQNALDRLQRVVTQYPEDNYSAKAQAAIREISDNGTISVGVASQNTGSKVKNSKPGNAAVITGMRFWSNPNYTRLVIDADQEMKFDYNLLNKDPSIDKPQRLYVDLHNSRLGKGLDKIIPINDDLLRHARAGQYHRKWCM